MMMTIARTGLAIVLASIVAAGCTNGGYLFNGPKKDTGPAVDANPYPTNYRNQVATFLITELSDRADYRASFIAQPVLMPFGTNQHYVVCVRLDGHGQHKDKAVVYLAGSINQYIDATPEQCASAPYEPFKELVPLMPT
jgi:hypothetical protein